MKLYVNVHDKINGVYIKAFGKLKMYGLKRGFIKHWLNSV